MAKENILRVGDLATIKYALYVFDYHAASHHFKCRITDGTKTRMAEKIIWFPAQVKYFNHITPPEKEYIVPKNFKSSKTVDGITYNAIIPASFKEDGVILWKAEGDKNTQISYNFVAKEGILNDNYGYSEIMDYYGSQLEQGLVKGEVVRIYKIQFNYGEDTTEDLIRLDFIDLNNDKHGDIFSHNSPATVVLSIDSKYEIHVPHTIVEKLIPNEV